MPQQRGPGLSLAEWLVLCLVSEKPMHGFAIASLLAEDGSLGRVWHVRKAVVYRAAQRLEELGLIVASGKQPSSLGRPGSSCRPRPRAAGPPKNGCASRPTMPATSAPNCC